MKKNRNPFMGIGKPFPWVKFLITMKLTLLFGLLLVVQSFANQSYSQEATLNLNIRDASIKDALKEIENQSKYYFLYNDDLVDVSKKVNIDMKNSNIQVVLNQLFKGQRITYIIKDRQIVLSPLVIENNKVVQQIRTVRGKITDSSGSPLPGVTIVVKGSTKGTVTDAEGNYSISDVSGDNTLLFSFIGMKTMEIPIANQEVINVTMEEEAVGLEEVVAIGYGTARRKDLTGSVATISGEELKKIPIANTAEAIKGRLPGVNIISTDGSPDADIVIRVRGGGSVTQDNSPLYVVDGFIVGSIRDIPPSDITSINVLKDAAATAIYGAQAANGVILVTTKSPTAGKAQVSYNGYVQIKNLPLDRKYDVLDPYEYVLMRYEIAKLSSSTSTLQSFERYFGKYEDLELYQYEKGTDWQDEIFGNSQISQSHNLSLSGGTEKTKLSLSLTNNKDDGIMIGNGYERNSLNFKLNQSISKSLEFDGNIRITDTQVDGGGTSGGSMISIGSIVKARPVNGIADQLEIDPGVDTGDDYQAFLANAINPIELAKQYWRRRYDTNYVLQGGLTWKPIENLTIRSAFTNSTSYNEYKIFYGPLTYESSQNGNSLPLGTVNNSKSNSYRWVNTINYSFENLGEHSLNFLLGHEIYSSGGKSSYVRVENFRESITPDEMFANMALGSFDAYSSSQSTKQNRVSFFGRANYQFKQKYMLTATVRSDASSKFSKENRVGIFPAVALGWKINDEGFMAGARNIDELKLRVSYGQTGNDRISANATKFLFTGTTTYGPGMGTNAYNPYYTPEGSTLYNPNLVWETTINRNAGLDYIFFKGGIRGSLDFYRNTTKDLLLASAISPIAGFSTQWNNIGSTSNKGFEMALTINLIDRDDFTFSGNLNFGRNIAKIDALDGTDQRFYQSNWASTDLSDRDDYYLKVGGTIGMIYGYVTDGMYSVDDFTGYDETLQKYILKEGVPDDHSKIGVSSVRPGYMKLKDLSGPEGKPDGIIDSNDRTVIGNALPDATGGFGFDATFKGFDASIFFNWSLGNDIYNTGKISYNSQYRSSYGNMLTSMSMDKRFTYIDVNGTYTGTPGEVVTDLEQLRKMNENKTIWSGDMSFSYASAVVTDWAIEDGSYIRLNNVTLGYTLPTHISFKIGISKLRVYVSGNNLHLWTKYSGYDPEVSTSRSSAYSALTPGLDFSSYPRSRSFTFGLNVTF